MQLLLAPWRFVKDMYRTLPMGWFLWVQLLVAIHFIAPVFFVEHLAAQAMLVAAFLGFAILIVMNETMGMTRLMGLAHVPWVVPMALVYSDLASGLFAGEPYQVWLWAAALVGTACLIIDLSDVLRYLRGERAAL